MSIGHESGYQVVNDLVNMRRRTNIYVVTRKAKGILCKAPYFLRASRFQIANNVLKVLVISVVVGIGLGIIQTKVCLILVEAIVT